jgi:hypothetical protein
MSAGFLLDGACRYSRMQQVVAGKSEVGEISIQPRPSALPRRGSRRSPLTNRADTISQRVLI